MVIEVESVADMKALGEKLGAYVRGGEVIELVGDIGAGKTTFAKGVARGMGIDEDVQSPSFTISRRYDAMHNLQLAHYDFYRLIDAGIMKDELEESVHDPQMVTLIEWGNLVEGILPPQRLTISISSPSEKTRMISLSGDTYGAWWQ